MSGRKTSRRYRAIGAFRVTAAITSGQSFCLVTLNWTGRSVQLVPTACWTSRMDEKTLCSPGFELELQAFLVERDVQHVVIRRGVYSGPRRASPLALKVETFLEQIPTLSTSLVHANTVTGWLQRQDWLLPLPQTWLSAPERAVQARGIATAALVVAKVLERRASLHQARSAVRSPRTSIASVTNSRVEVAA